MNNAAGDNVVLHPDYSQIIQPTQGEIAHISQNAQQSLPKIIQGGMGVNISSPHLAATISGASRPGRETLGTISGTAVDRVMARMLQMGGTDADDIIRVLGDFPFPEVAERVIKKYHNNPKVGIPPFTVNPTRDLIDLVVCANYAFVKLSKRGHNNPVSINYLEKISMPHLASIYGAMLAEVDVVTMGAGMPFGIPEIFQAFAEGREASYSIPVIGGEGYKMKFDPKNHYGSNIPQLKIPKFIPIISSDSLGNILKMKLPKGSIYGFAIEAPDKDGHPTAGGHNAPPRDKGTNQYGERDKINFKKMHDLGIPYWMGGSFSSEDALNVAYNFDANGIQVGGMFALARESGMRPELRSQILEMAYNGNLKIITDPLASPTGFPFKVAEVPGTMSEELICKTRKRVCDECALRSAYQKPNRQIGYRCASEPEDDYERKGGRREDTVGRKCICNGLMAAAGVKDDELSIVTLGDRVEEFVQKLLNGPHESYGALQALDYLFSKQKA